MQLWIEQNQWLMKLKLLITEKVEYTAEIEDTSLKKKKFWKRYSWGFLCFKHNQKEGENIVYVLINTGLVLKNCPANAADVRDTGPILGLGISPEEGNGNPLQHSCLENPMDRGAWRAKVHRVIKTGHNRSNLIQHIKSHNSIWLPFLHKWSKIHWNLVFRWLKIRNIYAINFKQLRTQISFFLRDATIYTLYIIDKKGKRRSLITFNKHRLFIKIF